MYRSSAALIAGGVLGATKWPAAFDLTIARGGGARLWTTQGASMIDYLLGSGPMVLGHSHPQVLAAIQEQLHLGMQYYSLNEPALRLAARVSELVPCARSVKFVVDGTSATFYALRLARAFTGRALVLKFEGSYHGGHDYALRGFQPDSRQNHAFGPISAGIPPEVSDTVLVAPFNDIETAAALILARGDELAAVIVEPIQRSLLPCEGFLYGLRELCDRVGALLVFDEVVTGFRVAMGGCQEVFGVIPDLCALGKILGGGLPLGAVAGRRDIMELLDPGRRDDGRSVFLEGTMNGNALAAAAGLATLEVLENEHGPARLTSIGAKLTECFIDCAKRLSVPLQIIGPSCLPEPVFDQMPIFDDRSYRATNRVAARQFGYELLKRGLFLRMGSKFYVSLMHDDDILEQTGAIVFEAMRAVRDDGFLEEGISQGDENGSDRISQREVRS